MLPCIHNIIVYKLHPDDISITDIVSDDWVSKRLRQMDVCQEHRVLSSYSLSKLRKLDINRRLDIACINRNRDGRYKSVARLYSSHLVNATNLRPANRAALVYHVVEHT